MALESVVLDFDIEWQIASSADDQARDERGWEGLRDASSRLSALMGRDGDEALMGMWESPDRSGPTPARYVLADDLEGIVHEAFSDALAAGDEVTLTDVGGDLVVAVDGDPAGKMSVRGITADALEALGSAEAADTPEAAKASARSAAWSSSRAPDLARRSYGHNPYESIGTPERMLAWRDAAESELVGLAAHDFPPPAGPGGYYDVTGSGDYVSEADFESVLPGGYLGSLYVALTNGLTTDHDVSGAEEFCTHLGDVAWTGEEASRSTDGDGACFYTEFYEDDYPAAFERGQAELDRETERALDEAFGAGAGEVEGQRAATGINTPEASGQISVCVGNYGYYAEGELRDQWITLPKEPGEIDGFLRRNSLVDEAHEETYISDYDGIPLGMSYGGAFSEYTSLEDLNLLAHAMAEADPADLERLDGSGRGGEEVTTVDELGLEADPRLVGDLTDQEVRTQLARMVSYFPSPADPVPHGLASEERTLLVMADGLDAFSREAVRAFVDNEVSYPNDPAEVASVIAQSDQINYMRYSSDALNLDLRVGETLVEEFGMESVTEDDLEMYLDYEALGEWLADAGVVLGDEGFIEGDMPADDFYSKEQLVEMYLLEEGRADATDRGLSPSVGEMVSEAAAAQGGAHEDDRSQGSRGDERS